jgi:hypothetical protein
MMNFSTEGWCSNEDGEAEKWLWERFHNDDRFVPVVWSPQHPKKRLEYQNPPDEQMTIFSKLTVEPLTDPDNDTSSGSPRGSVGSEESKDRSEGTTVVMGQSVDSPTSKNNEDGL